MLKKTIKFKNFNGEEARMDAYFNLTRVELIRLEARYDGGLEKYISTFDPENKPKPVLEFFENFIMESYGRKSDDGLYFIKDPDEALLFMQSAAYDALFMDLISDTDKATDFINAVVGSIGQITTTVSN